MTVLVTGAAGFIGYHLCEALLARGETVIGVDVLSDYYDVHLKKARLERLESHAGFSMERMDTEGPIDFHLGHDSLLAIGVTENLTFFYN